MRNKNATLVFPSKLKHPLDTGKSLSEALIINPKFDDKLFIAVETHPCNENRVFPV